MPKYCYNCGTEINKLNRTKEHIPAQCLYEGFDDSYKLNRLTVPCCHQCNSEYSKIDQEIRDVLAFINAGEVQNSNLVKGGIRSIFSRANWKEKLFVCEEQKTASFEFSYNDLREIHTKNFKGLFLKKYQTILPGHFKIEIIADGDDDVEKAAQHLYDYLTFDSQWKYSGHQDIFKYILKDIGFDSNKDSFLELGDLSKAVAVVGLLVYHNHVAAIVVAGDKEFIEQCKRAE